jgi:alkanesulfonate monooxygenase
MLMPYIEDSPTPNTFRQLSGIDVYTSSPSEDVQSGEAFMARLRQVAQWSDRHGCRGMLIYTDNRSSDPWVLAQDVIARTNRLSPLIAVQPAYMHPYAAAQKVAALARVYGRSVDLNLVAGGFQFDLAALDDRLGHDARYERLSEYGLIMTKLLAGERVTVRGQYYNVFGLKLHWHVSNDLFPRLTVSGSSPGGLKCAGLLNAAAVMYPKPLSPAQAYSATVLEEAQRAELHTGIRIGILARETAAAAWSEAKAWFPDNPEGQAMRNDAVQATDSSWLHQLSTLTGDHNTIGQGVYWLGPFASAKSFCPYLVGSYDDVAAYLSAYLRGGVRLIILDCPRREEDLVHAYNALQRSASTEVTSVPAWDKPPAALDRRG